MRQPDEVEVVELHEAARRLGLSLGALRKRLQRKTVAGHIGPNGRWYVHLPAPVGVETIDVDPDDPLLDRAWEMVRARREAAARLEEDGEDSGIGQPDTVVGQDAPVLGQPATPPTTPAPDETPVVAAMRQTIDALTAQLDRAHDQLAVKDEQIRRAQEAEAEQRRIIAGLMQRLPELPATISTRREDQAEASATTPAAVPPVGAAPTTAPEAPSERPRPWWRRLLGR